MANLLIRFGLYTILITLALFILREQVRELPFGEYLTDALLGETALAGLAMTVIGIVLLPLDRKRQKKVGKGKCVICRRPVIVGQLYCREHLRQMLAEEDDRRHAPAPRR